MARPNCARQSLVLVGVAAVLVGVAIIAHVRRAGSRRAALVQALFDLDGPSPRDPPKAAWARAGEGTAAKMERATSHRKHSRGRQDRMWDSLIRHAPREVSTALAIPMAKVQKLERKVAKELARRDKRNRQVQHIHAVHRGLLKGGGSSMLAAAVNVTDMTTCEGKYLGCDALAENIIEVAKSINQNCASLYFDEKAYYKCEAELAAPMCQQAKHDFPDMCGPDGLGYAGKTGYSVEHGYWSGESPANIHGAFCNGCAQIERSRYPPPLPRRFQVSVFWRLISLNSPT